MAQGAASEAPDEMKRFYTEAQTLLLSTYAVLVPIYHPDRYYRSRSWVAGLSIDPFNFLTLRDIHISAPTK